MYGICNRAEYRLYMRADNADLRLSGKGYGAGIVSSDRMEMMMARESAVSQVSSHTRPGRVGIWSYRTVFCCFVSLLVVVLLLFGLFVLLLLLLLYVCLCWCYVIFGEEP